MSLAKPLYELNTFNNLINSLKNNTTLLANGISEGQREHLINSILQNNKSGLVITNDEISAKKTYNNLQYFLGEDVVFYPAKDIIFYNADVKSIDIVKERFKAINKLISNERTVIVLSIEALFDRLTPFDTFKNFIVELNVGDNISIDDIIRKLNSMGYKSCFSVESEGQYSTRGGIVDLFVPASPTAYRIEFWGDEIDSIRMLDSYSQRSIDKVNNIKILPIREFIYTSENADNAIKLIESEFKSTLDSFSTKGLKNEYDNLKYTFNEIIENLKETKTCRGLESLIDFFYNEKTTLIDYLQEDTIIFIDEPKKVSTQAFNTLKEFTESLENRILNGYMLKSQINSINDYEYILSKINSFNTVLLSSMSNTIKDFKPKHIFNFDTKMTPSYNGQLDLLLEDIKYYKENNFKIVILSGNKHSANRIVEELMSDDIISNYTNSFEDVNFQNGNIYVSTGVLSRGFVYPSINFVVISDNDLFGQNKVRKKRKKKKGKAIQNFTDLKVGDYIVHINHGIGVYKGIEKIITNGKTKDYIKLSYKDDGNLFLPTEQLDLVQKYSGGNDAVPPKIDKLGSDKWQKAKQKTKKAVEILAQELIELYAKRQESVGFQYSEDNVWQQEFEEMFIYSETNDQLDAIQDVKQDMESKRKMDRLICGDVGFGKTEVAIRCAFKAVQDGKQVAYLVPTTILAQQHYNTFVERMSNFPINIELLSRFRTPKQQKETKQNLKSGYCDIVVGTHAILSKTVEFKDLGVIIVDEEQRFGVKHKEQLKNMKNNVDVLTLSATPIPRTLHMSLTGVRDMSLLEEAPVDRTPIQTYLLERNFEFIKDAINRELSRNGQIYFVHNRVDTIDSVANELRSIIPNATIEYAHGQMSENELEKVMGDFIDREIDILVCTTIIETGLDISNANTIIIDNSDYMGLSQLYQLRGRVGRSKRNAYCYLLYERNKILNEVSEKRLKTIRDFTEFGSGFKIAMKDLEIRGAGSMLGMQQHGHINAVGYDMYCKLLDDAVKKLKGEKVSTPDETSISINISAFIPENYIKDEMQKLEIYKKISLIIDEKTMYDIEEEIEDRFGDIPKAVRNLLDIAMLKSTANNIGITHITEKKKETHIIFKEKANADINKILDLVEKDRDIKFITTGNPTLVFKKSISVIELTELLKSITAEVIEV